jgi:hypothetical protein
MFVIAPARCARLFKFVASFGQLSDHRAQETR